MGRKLTQEEFIFKAVEKHGEGRYDYSKVLYLSSQKKVEMVCKKHGSFFQAPSSHLRGDGCKKCNQQPLKTTEQFILDAKKIHGDKYDYSKTEYKGIYEKITVTCNKHGNFTKQAKSFLVGGGCKYCGYENTAIKNAHRENIWKYDKWTNMGKNSENFNSFKVYIVKFKDIVTNEVFYKIGKTFRTTKERIREIPYTFEIIKEITSDNGIEICKLETSLIKDNKENKYKPLKTFKGQYECFSKINVE